MAGDLTLRITVTEIETLQKNRLHVAGECGRRGRCGHQHFVAAVDQVPRAGLMKRRCELVVDVPAIMVSMAVEKGAKTAVVWLLFTLPLSLLEGGVLSERPAAVKGAPVLRGEANPSRRGPF